MVVSAFADTIYDYYDLEYTIIDNSSVSIYGCSEDATDISVPAVINGRSVISIGNRAFLDNTVITSVDLSDAENLEVIGMFAFKGCSALNGNLVIPSFVQRIDTAAFQECSSLSSAVINASITEIPSQMFYKCDSLSSVTIPETVTSIGSYAFADCPNLTYIEIPASVESIAYSAFQHDDIKLGVYTDSAAHQYAVDRGITFDLLDAPVEPTDPPTEPETEAPTDPPTEPETEAPTDPPTEPVVVTFLLGDADGDNEVTILDATKIQRVLASLETDDDGMVALRGSVDGETPLNILHATKIQRFIADFTVAEPINTYVTRTLEQPEA